MMISFRVLILTIAVFLASNAHGKIPGHLYLTGRGGMPFPGIASEGTSFKGKSFSLSVAYIPVPDSKVGMQISAGLESNYYRHFFDDRIFIEHIQRGITSDICARLTVGERAHVLVGINVFLPLRRVVDMGERNFNATFFYSNDSLISRYKSSPLQASAVIAIDYSFGRKGQSHFGLRIAQAGNSPVREDAVYNDASGNTVHISRKMKPASVQLYLSVRIIPREKRKEKLVERE